MISSGDPIEEFAKEGARESGELSVVILLVVAMLWDAREGAAKEAGAFRVVILCEGIILVR
jgi:hypothetical protein